MNNCATCGKPVRLGALKIRINGRQGIYHYIQHMDGTSVQNSKRWSCSAAKPYAKNRAERPSQILIADWNRENPEAPKDKDNE